MSVLAEDYRLVMISQNLVLDMLLHCTREHYLFQILTLEHKCLRGILMRYAHHVLLYDRTCVELGSNVVARSTYNLHTPLVCLVIWLGTYKGRQERVVDIDYAVRETLYHLLRDNLHIACQHYEVNVFLLHQFQLSLLYLLLVRPILVYRPYIIRYAKLLSHIAQVLVVAHYAGDVALQFTSLVASQQVVEAMAHLAHEECHSRTLVAEVQLKLHLITLTVESLYVFLQFLVGNGEIIQLPLHSHEETVVHRVHILVEINDVTIIIGDETCHLRYDALLVRTMQ